MRTLLFLGGAYTLVVSCFLYPSSRMDDYEVVRKIGRGKYSEVFEGVPVGVFL